MFSTLDSIEWKKLGYHTYPQHEKIPGAIRDLLSPDADVREEARGFLLGAGQDFGDIYDTTPQIIPFCLEVLAMEGAPGKTELMQQLSGQGRTIAEAGIRSVHKMDLSLQAYAALRTGLGGILDLLVRGEHDERLAACELLQYMTDDSARLIPVLLERIEREMDDALQVGLLHCLKALFAALEWKHFRLKEQYAPALQRIVEGHSSLRVRIAAARASVELLQYQLRDEPLLSAQVAELLAQEFLHPGPPMHWMEEIPRLYQENLVHDLARLSDAAPMLRLLAEPGITAEQAHLIARGLLCQAFVPRTRQPHYWQQLASYEKHTQSDTYLFEHTVASFKLERGPVRAILQAITAADRVLGTPDQSVQLLLRVTQLAR